MSVTRIALLGDIVGSSGRKAVAHWLPQFKLENSVDLVIANGENAAHGFGLTPQITDEIFACGVDVITGGNHTWDKKEVHSVLEKFPDRVIRPGNYPKTSTGKGWTVVQAKNGVKVGVVNLMGRVFMDPLNCPFQEFEEIYQQIRKETPLICLDFHAEASSEKQAMGYFVDGRISVMVGTHTHVQTADNRVLPKGTGYITDMGMNGPLDSVIGMKKEIILERFTKKQPIRMEVADGPGIFQGVLVHVDSLSGRCQSVERIQKYPYV